MIKYAEFFECGSVSAVQALNKFIEQNSDIDITEVHPIQDESSRISIIVKLEGLEYQFEKMVENENMVV